MRSARADLTENNEYSLSSSTEKILDSLDEPLLIRAYISRKVHPIVQPLVPQIRDLLSEYGIVGGSKVRVEFVDGPQDGDQVVVQDRARVFVAEAVVPLVSTFTLDSGPEGGSTEELILR